jgi:hypothetical protein
MQKPVAKTRSFFRLSLGTAALLLCSIFFLCQSRATISQTTNAQAANPQAPDARIANWQQDIRIFSEDFPKDQKDFDKVYSKSKFDGEVASLQKDLPQLSDAEISLRLLRIIAVANIGHNSIAMPHAATYFRRIPLNYRWFSDGLGVVAASQEYNDAIGARVVRIGTMSPEQLETAVAPYISHETEIWVQEVSPQFINNYDLLQMLKVPDADGRVELTLQKAGGKSFTISVAAPDAGATVGTTDAASALHIPVPLSQKHPNSYYWYEILPESRTLYIQYNRCENDPKLSMAAFTDQMLAAAESAPIDRAVVDLRFNPGGNSSVVGPLIHRLKSWSKVSGSGHIYALIGRLTFSSGLMAAADFRNHLHAIIIGEQSGEMPDSYGEVRLLNLPNSHLTVRYTTRYFRLSGGTDKTTFGPDIPVSVSLEDFLAGRDPVLDAALQHPLK